MKISLIKVPYDQTNYAQGVGLAPKALISANIEEKLSRSNIEIHEVLEVNISGMDGDPISSLAKIGNRVSQFLVHARNNQSLPVILGGDCLNAIGITAGLRESLGEKDFGIAWADAHGDFNTPEISLSGFLPGMSLATVSGFGLPQLRENIGLNNHINPAHIILLGTRDLDPLEKELLETTPISYLNPQEVANGRTSVAAGYHFKDLEGFYLHIDMDALDPEDSPGIDFPVSGGITKPELIRAIQEIKKNTPLLAVSLVAINPTLDPNGKTIDSAIEILTSILIN